MPTKAAPTLANGRHIYLKAGTEVTATAAANEPTVPTVATLKLFANSRHTHIHTERKEKEQPKVRKHVRKSKKSERKDAGKRGQQSMT